MFQCITLCKSEFHKPTRATTVEWEGRDVCVDQTVPTRVGYLVYLPLCSYEPDEDWSRFFVQHCPSHLHRHMSLSPLVVTNTCLVVTCI